MNETRIWEMIEGMPFPDGIAVAGGNGQVQVVFQTWETSWLDNEGRSTGRRREVVYWSQDWSDDVYRLSMCGDDDELAEAMYECVAAALARSVMHEVMEFARRPSDQQRIWNPHEDVWAAACTPGMCAQIEPDLRCAVETVARRRRSNG